jgi:hypothetical protein
MAKSNKTGSCSERAMADRCPEGRRHGKAAQCFAVKGSVARMLPNVSLLISPKNKTACFRYVAGGFCALKKLQIN